MRVWVQQEQPSQVSFIDKNNLDKFVKQLCVNIGMKRWGKPQIVFFGKDRFKGYSLFQFITNSSITGHFTEKGEAYLNIFSCKKFNCKKAILFVKKFFETEIVKMVLRER